MRMGDERVEGLPVKTLTLPPRNNSVVLKNLRSYTVYRIEIWAFTRIGDGPMSTTHGGKASLLYLHTLFVNGRY